MFNKFYTPKIVKMALNLWPPFWGAGIAITDIGPNFTYVNVRLKLRWWNKNANRTQYGGSIFSMTDPIYALMLMGILGKEYYVWDKQAGINFIKPGSSELTARFCLSEDTIEAIYRETESGEKYFPEFVTSIVDKNGEVVAEVQRTLYIRKKPKFREAVVSQA